MFSYGCASFSWPARTYLRQLYTDAGCLETCGNQWMIGTNCKRESENSVYAARHNDDIYNVYNIYIYIYIYINTYSIYNTYI